MSIEINNPEIEAFIHKRLESGVFESVEEVLFNALESQDAEEATLFSESQLIREKIERGFAEAERGEGMTPEQCKAWMADRKAEWTAKKRPE